MQDIYTKSEQPKTVVLQAYYTDARELNDLMIELLGDVHGKTVLEPCVGKGAFVKPLIATASSIDAVDIDPEHVDEIKTLSAQNVCIQMGDFIDHFVSDSLFSKIKLRDEYDSIICNPPYGLKFSLEYRKRIKRKFPKIYARESYGLFMTFGISNLREGGRFVFIVPDTFLTSRNHAHLRRFLSQETNISHIVQFKSSRFETVNFGYGSLCIISGNRISTGQYDDVLWLDMRDDPRLMHTGLFENAPKFNAASLLKNADHGWSCPNTHTQLFSGSTTTLGEIAECRTGIYTGDNARFCAYDATKPPRRVNGHPISWQLVVGQEELSDQEQKEGVSGKMVYVPFIRGGHRLPFEPTSSALDWSREAVDYYRNDKKARLQNSSFYFREGLAVPMVTAGRLSASYFSGAVFDQGVVGVFPHDLGMIKFLLVFFNSDQATCLKKAINPAANNSANYIKRITVPSPTPLQLTKAELICSKWKAAYNLTKEECQKEATAFIEGEFSTI